MPRFDLVLSSQRQVMVPLAEPRMEGDLTFVVRRWVACVGTSWQSRLTADLFAPRPAVRPQRGSNKCIKAFQLSHSHALTQPTIVIGTLVMVPRNEKADVLPAALFVQDSRPRNSKWRVLGFVALVAAVLTSALHYVASSSGALFISPIGLDHRGAAKLCPQSSALYPKHHEQVWKSLGHDFKEKTFEERAVAWLQGAVRIP